MSTQSDGNIRFELNLNVSPSELFRGIEAWRELGLLSDDRVKQLCRQYLSSPLPDPPLQDPLKPAPSPSPSGKAKKRERVALLPMRTQKESPLAQLSQSLMEELSVRWLLFLGVFMVVVSSGLLAASQWEQFPAAGQYGVLWGYTIVFWLVSQWSDRKPNLTLTAQTLRIVTLLLVPLNFWATDRFGLWQTPLGWGTIAMAAISLTAIVWQLGRRVSFLSLSLLLLSYLHWGWEGSGFSLVAVYLGTVGIAVTTLRRQRPLAGTETAIALYALLILLGRAIFFAHVPLPQIGLAIGICGWLFTALSPHHRGRFRGKKKDPTPPNSPNSPSPESKKQSLVRTSPLPFSEPLGAILLFLGWLVAVGDQPAQAIAVSVLALWWLGDRLQQQWRRLELATIFLVGWQVLLLIGRVIPAGLRQNTVTTATQLTQAQDLPGTLLSLTWFPYLILMLWVNDWIDRQPKPKLARFGDVLALGFGILLAILGALNPSIRSLNLLFSTLTLFVVTGRRYRTSIFLIYLTHLTGLLTVASWVAWQFPDIQPQLWAALALGVMVGEWGIAAYREWQSQQFPFPLFPLVSEAEAKTRQVRIQLWRRSAWHLGCVLAGISYFLLFRFDTVLGDDSPWGLLWMVTPLALTAIAKLQVLTQRQWAGWLSIGGLGLVQLLTLGSPALRLLSLGAATLLMLWNTYYVWHPAAAAITLGFGLSVIGVGLWQGIPGIPPLSFEAWLVVGAMACASLWLLWGGLRRLDGPLSRLYVPAANGWAIALCLWELAIVTVHSLVVFWQLTPSSLWAMVSVGLILGGILYRCWGQPSNWAICGIGWGFELLAIEILGFVGISRITLAIANLALGLLTQLLGDWWYRRTRQPLPFGWHVIPLCYGGVATLLRVHFVTPWTGLTSLGLAAIAIGVGRRSLRLKPLVYLGLMGVSAAAYEILWYRIADLWDGDRLMAMAALGTTIAYGYRVLLPSLTSYLRCTVGELKMVAHLHWAVSSYLLVAATFNPVQVNNWIGLGTGILLTRYAIVQGRIGGDGEAARLDKPNPKDLWVYLGLLEGAGVAIFVAQQLQLGGFLLPWAGAMAAIAAYFLYLLPWANWGWSPRPWQNSALIIPSAVVLFTNPDVNAYSLLFVALFYGILAKLKHQIRFTYFSLIFLNWLILKTLLDSSFDHILGYVVPPVLSVLYMAQFDPTLKEPHQRNIRHFIRILATTTLCLVAFTTENWFVSGVLSLLFLFSGLTFKVRAFLYVGTVVFLLNAFNQLVLLSSIYSFLKWLVGISIGLALIWIAANFEIRRTQIQIVLQNWISELKQWE